MTSRRGPWILHDTRDVYENAWMRVREHDVTRPDGQSGLYGVVSPKSLAIAVLPIHPGGDVTLVGQHRFALDAYSWEIPEGGGNPDGDPLDCAARELREETGLIAQHWRQILDMDLSNSITDERAIGFLATGLEQGEAAPDGTEVLEIRRLHFRDALAEAASGKIRDALTVAMLYRAYYMASEGALEAELAASLLRR